MVRVSRHRRGGRNALPVLDGERRGLRELRSTGLDLVTLPGRRDEREGRHLSEVAGWGMHRSASWSHEAELRESAGSSRSLRRDLACRFAQAPQDSREPHQSVISRRLPAVQDLPQFQPIIRKLTEVRLFWFVIRLIPPGCWDVPVVVDVDVNCIMPCLFQMKSLSARARSSATFICTSDSGIDLSGSESLFDPAWNVSSTCCILDSRSPAMRELLTRPCRGRGSRPSNVLVGVG
jgi:hypothetical protein